jgi:hypothetical protein
MIISHISILNVKVEIPGFEPFFVSDSSSKETKYLLIKALHDSVSDMDVGDLFKSQLVIGWLRNSIEEREGING